MKLALKTIFAFSTYNGRFCYCSWKMMFSLQRTLDQFCYTHINALASIIYYFRVVVFCRCFFVWGVGRWATRRYSDSNNVITMASKELVYWENVPKNYKRNQHLTLDDVDLSYDNNKTTIRLVSLRAFRKYTYMLDNL